MHPQSPALTIGGTMLQESVDLVILGVTFNTKMTFEKNLRSVSRAASQLLGILRKSWQVFHDRLLLGSCLRGFVFPVLECCSDVWCSAADTHHRLLDRVIRGASFLTGGVCVCDLAYRRSVAVLSNQRLGVTRCTLFMVSWYPSCAVCAGAGFTPRCDRTSVHLYASSLQNLAVSLDCNSHCRYLCETILVTPCSMVWDWRVSRAWPMPFYWHSCSLTFCLLLFSLSLLSFYGLVLWGWGLRTDRVLIAFSQLIITNLF